MRAVEPEWFPTYEHEGVGPQRHLRLSNLFVACSIVGLCFLPPLSQDMVGHPSDMLVGAGEC